MKKIIKSLLIFILFILSFNIAFAEEGEEIIEDEYIMDGIYLNTYDEFNLKVGDTFKIDVYERLTNKTIEDEEERSIFGNKIEDAIFEVITEPKNMASVDSEGNVIALGKCYGAIVVYTSDYKYMTSCTIVIDDAVYVWEGWVIEDDKYYWHENERRAGLEGQGKFIYDPKSDAWYWLDASNGGARSQNEEIYIEEDDSWIRTLEDGKLATGWYEDENGKQYYDLEISRRYHGYHTIDDITYYFDLETGYLLDNKWLKENEKSYWYIEGIRQGIEESKEIIIEDKKYYLNSLDNGARLEDIEIKLNKDKEENIYRYDKNGVLVTGWYKENNDKYYYELDNGAKVFGHYEIDNKYYFDLETGKQLIHGWLKENNNYYWYEKGLVQGTKDDPKGVKGYDKKSKKYLVRGREIYDKDSKSWYWLDSNNNGARAIDKEVWMPYIFSDEEIGSTEGKWVRYDSNGQMIKGWYKNKKGRYYYDLESGAMLKGYQIIDDNYYYFNEVDGLLEYNGFKNIDDYDYWYEKGIRQGTNSDAKCVMGDETCRGREIYDPITDAWYWLDAINEGAKAINKEVWMPYIFSDEEIGSTEGKWVRYDNNGKMIKGWYTVEDEELYPNQIGNTYYYDLITGEMYKGFKTIDNNIYHFDEVSGIYLGN